MSPKKRGVLSLAALIVLFTILGIQKALAGPNSNGVGIQAAPVLISQPIHPGSFKLNVAVYNTGSDTETINLVVQNLSHRKTLTLQPAWVKFDEDNFSLGSGETKTIGLTLTVPDVHKGYYSSDIWARTTDGSSDGATLGAGAATIIEFKLGSGKANFAQFEHGGGGHLTKRQIRSINRAQRNASPVSSGSNGNGFPAGTGVIAVIVAAIAAFFALRHSHKHLGRHLPKVSKSAHKRTVAHKDNHDAKKARQAKMRAAANEARKK